MFFRRWSLACGLATLATAGVWYKLWSVMTSQIAAPRAFGVMAVLAAALALAALPAALLPRRLAPWLRSPAYAVVLASVAAVGLTVFFLNPRLAPWPAQLATAAFVLLATWLFARKPTDDQRLALGLLARAGLAVLALPVALLPWTLYGWTQDQPKLPGAPAPMAGPVRADAPKRIILVTFDALRARSTSLANPAVANTPTLAALAKEATYFPGLRAASDFTQTSMPTILSGISPRRFMRGVSSFGALVRQDRMPGLGRHLAAAGYKSYYATMGVSPVILGFQSGYEDGSSGSWLFDPNSFNTEAYLPVQEAFGWLGNRLTGRLNHEGQGENNLAFTRTTFRRAADMLGAHPDRSFVWVHVGAPHTPYFDVPAGDLGKDFKGKHYRWVSDEEVEHATPAHRKELEAIYERYVRFADSELGLFVKDLRARGLWDDSLVIVTSDHGEDHAAPGHPGHANGRVPEAVASVPLLIHRPGQHEPARDERLCAHVDLVPTVLDQVYGAYPRQLLGRDLFAPAPADRVVYSWGLMHRHFGRYQFPANLAAYRGGMKYVVSFDDRTGKREALYDLAQDPSEQVDVAATHPAEFVALREQARRDVDLYEGP